MRNEGNWLRRAGANFTNGVRRLMMGRYGHDRLNVALLLLGLVLCIISMFVQNNKLLVLLVTLSSYGLLFVALFRCFSRSTYKRYNENRKFLLMIDRIKDRTHRYYACPKCRQTVRVPKGKGKIAITCPKCREKFIKKT